VVAVDSNKHALGDFPDNVSHEVAETTDPPVAPRLIDRIAGEVGPGVLVNTTGALCNGGALCTAPGARRRGSCSTSSCGPHCG
jgi:hypothetical protein